MIKEISNFKWQVHDKSMYHGFGQYNTLRQHNLFTQRIRYLIPGYWGKSWWEVGFLWFPRRKRTEMECVIKEYSGRESFFYFRGTQENLRVIEEMGRIIQRAK